MDDDPGDELVLAALDELRPSDQELLRLVSWDGLSNEEIAVVLRLPRRVVALRLHRARKRFRAALEAITPSRETDASLLVRPPIVPIHLEQS
jgi:RNA polymerase sigma-70 factor (ECF subfamily)